MRQNNKINAIGKVANPGDQDWTENSYVLDFGAYGCTTLLAYGNHLEQAVEACGDWIIDHAPGLLATEEVNEAYAEAKAAGLDDDAAYERATVDTISFDSGNHYMHSWEIGIRAENPTRDRLREIFGADGTDIHR